MQSVDLALKNSPNWMWMRYTFNTFKYLWVIRMEFAREFSVTIWHAFLLSQKQRKLMKFLNNKKQNLLYIQNYLKRLLNCWDAMLKYYGSIFCLKYIKKNCYNCLYQLSSFHLRILKKIENCTSISIRAIYRHLSSSSSLVIFSCCSIMHNWIMLGADYVP